MIISNHSNEELLCVVADKDKPTQLEKELAKRLAAYEDSYDFLRRVENAETDIKHKQRMFLVNASALFLTKPFPDNFYYLSQNGIKEHIDSYMYADYKRFSSEYIWDQLCKLSKKFTKDIE